MNSQEFGAEIVNSVEKAIRTNDYTNLSREIRNTVDRATMQYREVRNINNYYADPARMAQNAASRPKNTNYYADPERMAKAHPGQVKNINNYYSQYNIGKNTMYSSQRGAYKIEVVKNNKFVPTPFMPNKVGVAGGVVEIVFSSIGMAFAAIWGLVIGIVGVAADVAVGAPMLFGMVVFGVCTFLLFNGISRVSLVNEFKRYAQVIGDKTYITYEELASLTGIPVKKLKSKIKKFTKKGFLPFLYTDKEETTIMFNKEVYDQYMQSQQALRERQIQEENEKAEAEKLGETAEIIKEGTAYISKIRTINDMIPGKEMTAKLDKLDEIMNRIFDKVKQDPDSADELRKFMNYYLPTTIKLLDAYVDLEKQTVQGENIVQTKHQIEEAMDTINLAFENLLDSLFQDMAWDISSDISVMRTMMAQDGLTQNSVKSQLNNPSANKAPSLTGMAAANTANKVGATAAAAQSVAAGAAATASASATATAASATATASATASATATQSQEDKITLQF